ncbi:hypothetical protein WKR88_13955 [Trinickia caryophylli]|uniref:Transposase n=1 Tax=Trinickia caryophylli TaxID=28094 RepID=A0A1X7GKY2_TRICW|nr:hypothetical protein [Trinickia caryophylli]PMS09151.1 hypothetical protein C0Z17_26515 [Trinickia caryophylli]TRX14994.1 hypothetical protein FNF07_27710 [Trinickia caryophylli]WQE14849.1 hypothetical protein U0034_20040 [Trinickia caryophylli]SMF71289.1 hypothetical protein SAMN06295900_116141 [Trinickia caryophylli]GLU35056.1 hypothetical protein Busp01_48980 [Trinickia caryophylli]
MEIERYKGYEIWGHAIAQDSGFAASGTVMRGHELIQGSGILAIFETEQEACSAGAEWARAWVDYHQ